MTISTTTQKVLINVKAEGTNEAARSIASVGKASESTTAALMKQAAAHEKVAEESKSAGTTGESAYTKLSAALGKFNFNMEAGKKIVEIADKGLQAYAKTSAGAAAEALRVQTAFSSAFETVRLRSVEPSSPSSR
ncbi:MAG: hypothetical protein SFX73_38555 [Kofleriaceae bacterium]|nr:hypothetical protein [Kofleriaceae bacterium]